VLKSFNKYNKLPNRPDIVLRDKKKEDLPADRCRHTRRFKL